MLFRKLVITSATTVLLSLPSLANDGFMGLPAGGLTLQKSADISMVDEDLYLSLDKVRVNYQFRNEGTTPVTAQIGFPMPGVPVAINFDPENDYGMPGMKSLEVLKFETRVDGKVVKSEPVVRAFLFPKDGDAAKWDRFRFTDAKDITAELTAAGVPLNFDAKAIKAAFAKLPDAKKKDWVARGIYTKDIDYERGEWFLSTVYVREQTFQPGKIVRVQHSYKPYPAGFVMVSDHFKYEPQLKIDTCVDETTDAAIKRVLSPEMGGIGHLIEYVLTTANTWKGPVGHYRLTVDKGSPKAIVSFCGNGVKKTGKTTFSLEATNFSPTQDIKVLIVEHAR